MSYSNWQQYQQLSVPCVSIRKFYCFPPRLSSVTLLSPSRATFTFVKIYSFGTIAVSFAYCNGPFCRRRSSRAVANFIGPTGIRSEVPVAQTVVVPLRLAVADARQIDLQLFASIRPRYYT